MDKPSPSTFKEDATHYWQTMGGILNVFCTNPDTSWLLLVNKVLELTISSWQAEIHLVKSEYLESCNLQVAIASSCQPTSYNAIMANLNMVFIDIATGADSKNHSPKSRQGSISFEGIVWVPLQTLMSHR
jgi:hypothetical protein